jgi:hypothetical protein
VLCYLFNPCQGASASSHGAVSDTQCVELGQGQSPTRISLQESCRIHKQSCCPKPIHITLQQRPVIPNSVFAQESTVYTHALHVYIVSTVTLYSSGSLAKSLVRLQYIQNSAARILMRVRKHEHITPILHSLHWLPVSTRIEYKVSLLTHQSIHGRAPPYLKEFLNQHNTTHSLRSTHSNLLHIPRTKLRTMGDRAFSAAAPRLWNALPDTLRAPQSTDCFKKGLKTFLEPVAL